MLKASLFGFTDACILVSGTKTIVGEGQMMQQNKLIKKIEINI